MPIDSRDIDPDLREILSHMKRFGRAYSGGLVERYHTEVAPIRQNVGNHSWGMALILYRFHPDPSHALIRAAVEHDVAEYIVGDTPATAKTRFPELRDVLHRAEAEISTTLLGNSEEELTEEEKLWLKLVDMLECLVFCHVMWKKLHLMVYLRIGMRATKYLNEMKKPSDIPQPLKVFMESLQHKIRQSHRREAHDD